MYWEGNYWQASQVPPFSMASMEQAFFSSGVGVLAPAAVAAVLGGHGAALFLFDVDGGHQFASFQCSVFWEEGEEKVPSDQGAEWNGAV